MGYILFYSMSSYITLKRSWQSPNSNLILLKFELLIFLIMREKEVRGDDELNFSKKTIIEVCT